MSPLGRLTILTGSNNGFIRPIEGKAQIVVYRDRIDIAEPRITRDMLVQYEVSYARRAVDREEAVRVRVPDNLPGGRAHQARGESAPEPPQGSLSERLNCEEPVAPRIPGLVPVERENQSGDEVKPQLSTASFIEQVESEFLELQVRDREAFALRQSEFVLRMSPTVRKALPSGRHVELCLLWTDSWDRDPDERMVWFKEALDLAIKVARTRPPAWSRVAIYLNKLPVLQAASLVESVIGGLGRPQTQQVVQLCSDAILGASPGLRSSLAKDKYAEACNAAIERLPNGSEASDALIADALGRIENDPPTASPEALGERFWSRVPVTSWIEHPRVIERIIAGTHRTSHKPAIQGPSTYAGLLAVVTSVLAPASAKVWERVPEALLSEATIWNAAPMAVRTSHIARISWFRDDNAAAIVVAALTESDLLDLSLEAADLDRFVPAVEASRRPWSEDELSLHVVRNRILRLLGGAKSVPLPGPMGATCCTWNPEEVWNQGDIILYPRTLSLPCGTVSIPAFGEVTDVNSSAVVLVDLARGDRSALPRTAQSGLPMISSILKTGARSVESFAVYTDHFHFTPSERFASILHHLLLSDMRFTGIAKTWAASRILPEIGEAQLRHIYRRLLGKAGGFTLAAIASTNDPPVCSDELSLFALRHALTQEPDWFRLTPSGGSEVWRGIRLTQPAPLIRLIRSTSGDDRLEWLDDLVSVLVTVSPGAWPPIPDDLLTEPQLWSVAPPTVKFDYLIKRLGTRRLDDRSDRIRQIADLISAAAEPDRREFASRLPASAKREASLFVLLSISEQIGIAWDGLICGSLANWSLLTRDERIRMIYRAAKNDQLVVALGDARDDDPLVHCVLTLYQHDPSAADDGAFGRAHRLLAGFVTNEAWQSDAPLDLDALLPNCPNGVVRNCEGRPWITPEESADGVTRARRAWCSRRRQACELRDDPDTSWRGPPLRLFGARVYPLSHLRNDEWSLLELMGARGIVPRVLGLTRPDEYIPKLAGWANRLNEIRPRLRCSRCDKIMVANFTYARFLARFAATVFRCPSGLGHDEAYINFCWYCNEIIDSREAQEKREEFYVCLRCGHGPMDSSRFKPGDVCPRCGREKMSDQGNKMYRCADCRHVIDLDHRLVGAGGRNGPAQYDSQYPDEDDVL